MSGSCFILTRYETVHCTVSAKFINEFGASCLLCFAQFTPPNKRQKAPKIAWTRCPSYFSIPPSATNCTHRLTCRFGRCFCTLCRGLHRRPAPFAREAKRFIYFIRRALATLSKINSHRKIRWLLTFKNYNSAITSTSQRTPLGKSLTATHERAGFEVK